MARTKTLKTADLLAGADTEGDADREAQAFADAISDMHEGTIDVSGDEDEGLSADELRQIGQDRLAKLQRGESINAAPAMTAKQKERVLSSKTDKGVRDDQPKEPKAPKVGVCIYSGLPTGGGDFRPGYDAKFKSALIRRFRGEPVNVSEMSANTAQRFTDGDLSTAEGALDAMRARNWEHFATTKAAKQQVAKDSRTPIEILQGTIEQAIRKYGAWDAEVEDVVASVMDTLNDFLPGDDEDAPTEPASGAAA
jgi:hypothetical protein